MELLIVFSVVGILFAILAIVFTFKFVLFKKRGGDLKEWKKKFLKEKRFFKKFKPIPFKKWKKHNSGIVLSSGKKRLGKIKNSFVIKNLGKNKKIEKLNLHKMSVCVSDKKSSICIAPPGSGKTQALLLPTLFYMINCKEKPNLIVTDPKPEIYEKINYQLLKNRYQIINLSTIEKVNNSGKYVTDFWNPLDEIANNHKKLLNCDNQMIKQQLISDIVKDINQITSYFKLSEKSDYWEDNGTAILQFMIAFILWKIECGEMDYKHLNLFNLKSNLDIITANEWIQEIKFIKSKLNKGDKSLSLHILSRYLKWSNEREENVSSFITNALGNIDAFSEIYLAALTTKTTFDIDQIIQNNKPFIIFLTINTASNAHINEKMLLKIWMMRINAKIDFYKKNNPDFNKRPLWWLLDEAGNIPKLDFLKSVISFGRGRNEFALPIFQSQSQMKNIYNDELFDSCEYKIFFTNDNDRLGEKISNISGISETIDSKERIRKDKNLDLENVVNIPSGYLGFSALKRNLKDKNFYICPVTYFYMLNTNENKLLSVRQPKEKLNQNKPSFIANNPRLTILAKSKLNELKSNEKYLLEDYAFKINLNSPDKKDFKKEQLKKNWKFGWLGISQEDLDLKHKNKSLELMNHLSNQLNYFKYNDLEENRIIDIKTKFKELKAINKKSFNDSFIWSFICNAKENKNLFKEVEYEDIEN